MTYKFESNLKYVSEIVYTEQKRVELQKKSLEQSLRYLDKLKNKTKAPTKSSAQLWEQKSQNTKDAELIQFVIDFENAYIKANQFIQFANGTFDELLNIKLQTTALSKIMKGEELSQDQKKYYHPVNLHDCNEIFRYITVWDLNDFIYKVDEKYRDDIWVLSELNKPNIQRLLKESGYKMYVDELAVEYQKSLNKAQEMRDKTLTKYYAVKTQLDKINKEFNYTHEYPANYYDGSREPIGFSNYKNSQYEYDKMIKNCLEEYKKDSKKDKTFIYKDR